MRRPLLVLVLATMAVGRAQTAFAAVHWPSGSSQSGHASHLQKLARRVVVYARHQVGVGYRWGGTSPQTGFDCSGLVYAAYRSIGWKIPRSSWDQLRVGRPVRFARLRPGDLLFTEGGRPRSIRADRHADVLYPLEKLLSSAFAALKSALFRAAP